MYNIDDIKNTIINGDVLEVLKEIPDNSIDMCITSPPYWNLRDYNVEGQLGNEYTTKEFIEKLIEIFNEVKRVLKDTGTCWVNIRDTYSKGIKRCGVKNKSLSMIPERFAIKMLDNGWILRNDIIWHKPNAMPDSCKNRFTVDYEHLYLFSKLEKGYYFETQYEEYVAKQHKTPNNKPINNNNTGKQKILLDSGVVRHGAKGSTLNDSAKWSEKGRIKRTTWSINTKPLKGIHVAPFPEKLIETPIKAGCTENGIVLDIFMGSGTTGVVSKKLNRNFIGIELNKEYIKEALNRIDSIDK